MKSILRKIFRFFCSIYPFENGKYYFLQNYYFKYFAPSSKTEIISKIKFGIKMKLDISEYIQAHLYNYGSYELPTMNFIQMNMTEGMNVLDIGGNVGLMTLTFANFAGKSGKVFTFEPEPRNFAKLTENIKLNNFTNTTINQVAVSSKEEKLKLYLSNNNNSGVHSLIYNDDLKKEFVEVDTVTIDKFLERNHISKLDMVKIDVEGSELDVLEGIENTLLKFKPVLIMEVVSQYLKSRGSSSVEFKRLMNSKFGYKAFLVNNDGSLRLDSPDNENGSDNIIFKI